jgi:hypothetical protein
MAEVVSHRQSDLWLPWCSPNICRRLVADAVCAVARMYAQYSYMYWAGSSLLDEEAEPRGRKGALVLETCVNHTSTGVVTEGTH